MTLRAKATYQFRWRELFDGFGWLVLAGILVAGQVCLPLIFNAS